MSIIIQYAVGYVFAVFGRVIQKKKKKNQCHHIDTRKTTISSYNENEISS